MTYVEVTQPNVATAQMRAVTGDRVQLQQVILNLLKNASDAMSAVDDRPRQLQIRTEYITKNDGMGIGLSVSRSIIERQRGRLWAEPNDGSGSDLLIFDSPAAKGVTNAG